MEQRIGFKIENYSLENDSISVRPYSPLFKNSIESYPVYNITISNLDYSKDISTQIGLTVKPIVESIIARENLELQTAAANAIDSLLGQTITVSLSTSNENASNINFVA